MNTHTSTYTYTQLHTLPQVASDQVAQKVGVKAGALLQTVAPGGAAAKAGLLATRRGLGGIIPGDAVLAVRGRGGAGRQQAARPEWVGGWHRPGGPRQRAEPGKRRRQAGPAARARARAPCCHARRGAPSTHQNLQQS